MVAQIKRVYFISVKEEGASPDATAAARGRVCLLQRI
jgi:hypothetical protein